MESCMVPSCKNKNGIEGVSCFRLTKERYLEWMFALGKDVDKGTPYDSYVCSDHFLPEDFKLNSAGEKILKSNAVPCVNLRPAVTRHDPPINKTFEAKEESDDSCVTELSFNISTSTQKDVENISLEVNKSTDVETDSTNDSLEVNRLKDVKTDTSNNVFTLISLEVNKSSTDVESDTSNTDLQIDEDLLEPADILKASLEIEDSLLEPADIWLEILDPSFETVEQLPENCDDVKLEAATSLDSSENRGEDLEELPGMKEDRSSSNSEEVQEKSPKSKRSQTEMTNKDSKSLESLKSMDGLIIENHLLREDLRKQNFKISHLLQHVCALQQVVIDLKTLLEMQDKR